MNLYRALGVLLSVLLSVVGCGSDADDDATATNSAALVATVQINSGGGALSPFSADQFFSGGSPYSSSNVVSTTGVTNAAPAAVYQTERFGNFSYTIGSLTPNASYTVRLHFAEIYFTAAGKRKFNVLVNSVQALSNLDIFAVAGANKALVYDAITTASSSGQITVQYVSVVENPKSSGIEILSAGGGSNQSPTIVNTATASPNPATGTTSALSVLGADDGGEANLTYTWAATGTPPAPVSFSANGTNAAKNASATFSKAGSYTLAVTLRDASGATASSSINVVVNQTFTRIAVTPASVQVAPGSTQQFTASAQDQFGNAMTSQPALTWSVTGGGTVSSSGLFTASSSGTGTFTISATSGGISGTASVTVTAGTSTALYQINSGGGAVSPFTADQLFSGGNPYSTGSAVSTTGVANAAPPAVYQSERFGNFSYTIGSLTPSASYTIRLHFAEIYFTASGRRKFNVVVNGVQAVTNLDIFAVAGANKALVYDVNTSASSGGQIVIQYVSLIDNAKASGIEILSAGGGSNQTLTSIVVTPASAQVAAGGTQQFTASARDQVGNPMANQPAFAWSVTGGGTMSSSGLFSASSNSGTFTVSAASGGITGTASVTVTSGTVSYATDFNLIELPISESGKWRHTGLDWTLVQTANGTAFGTQTGTGGYDDSYAYLSGFPANQSASGIVYKASGIDPSCTHEVEILLRWTDSAHDAHGYECNLAWDGSYAEIVRWNGPVGNFTYLARGSVSGGVRDGDTLSASIVGNVITLVVNGVEIARATDSTFTTGNPGMGFWLGGGCGGNSKYGFTRYTATSL